MRRGAQECTGVHRSAQGCVCVCAEVLTRYTGICRAVTSTLVSPTYLYVYMYSYTTEVKGQI